MTCISKRLQLLLGWTVVGALNSTYTLAATNRKIQDSTKADYVTSRLMITSPQSLFYEEGYDHTEARFGIPPYGDSIAQTVYYADSDLCDPSVDTSKGYPAREINKDGVMEPWPSPYILMVDRGNCTFVTKVRNAQRSGAAAAIIADDTCMCLDLDCLSQSGIADCDTQMPVMDDDGTGSDISIPTFLMLKRDADNVKRELQANRPVQIEMIWNLPNPDDRVEYEVWTTPFDLVGQDFLTRFGKIAEALGDRAYFTPHMYIYDQCQGNSGKNYSYCSNLCTNNGRYCAPDPDGDFEHGISGAEVVVESLRRLCIWNMYGASNGIGKEWWTYVSTFNDQCSLERFSNKGCINEAYKVSKIDGKAVERCMEDSGGTDKDQSNSKLYLEISAQKQRGINSKIIPALFVNKAAIQGATVVQNVFPAICAGYQAGTQPEVCTECAHCGDPFACVESGSCMSRDFKDVYIILSISSVFMIIGAFMAWRIWHHKQKKDKQVVDPTQEQVQCTLPELT